jgi:hypothetical protein
MNEKLKKLHSTLQEENLLSIGFNTFIEKLNNQDGYSDLVTDTVINAEEPLYSGSEEDFKSEYFVDLGKEEKKPETDLEKEKGVDTTGAIEGFDSYLEALANEDYRDDNIKDNDSNIPGFLVIVELKSSLSFLTFSISNNLESLSLILSSL